MPQASFSVKYITPRLIQLIDYFWSMIKHSLILFLLRPTPDYSWTFRGKADGPEKTIIGGQDGYELQDYNHVLMITNVATTHDGWYKCKVRSNYNDQVHEDEKEARLYVKGLHYILVRRAW